MRIWPALLCLLFTAPSSTTAQHSEPSNGAVLIFSGTTGYRHDSIPAGVAAVTGIAKAKGLEVVASEDPAMFAADRLARFRVIVLLSTTTDPKNPASEWLVGSRRDALQAFVRRGGGILAVHAAADSHYHWPWYSRLIGGHFASHPEGTPTGLVSVTDPDHPATRSLPRTTRRTDEWYYFDDYDPTSRLLVQLDPVSIGEKDVNPNPLSWTREVDGGRLFYTAMGHTRESFAEPYMLEHLSGGLDWVLGQRDEVTR